MTTTVLLRNMNQSGRGGMRWLALLGIAALCGGLFHPVHAQEAARGDTDQPEILSVQKIWDRGPHNAFTDLIRFDGKWFCTFREGLGHVGGDGSIRILVSEDGSAWESAAVLTADDVDLRDPKLCITPDNRLMAVMGGSLYEGRTRVGMRPRVAFSKDGFDWDGPTKVLDEGKWLWRLTWHKGTGYGSAITIYEYAGMEDQDGAARGINLYKTEDGLEYTHLAEWEVPDKPSESTIRFMPDDEAIALARRDPGHAYIGTSRPPYTEWDWTETDYRIGGPNFIRLDDGSLWAAGRIYPGGARTMLLRMTKDNLEPVLELPSGGDNSYPGMVWHEGILWMSYYSSHEGKSSIYLAKIRIPGVE